MRAIAQVTLLSMAAALAVTASATTVEVVSVGNEEAVLVRDGDGGTVISRELEVSKLVLTSLLSRGDSAGELRARLTWSSKGFGNDMQRWNADRESDGKELYHWPQGLIAQVVVHMPTPEGGIETLAQEELLSLGEPQDVVFMLPKELVNAAHRIGIGTGTWHPTIHVRIEWKGTKIPLSMEPQPIEFREGHGDHIKVLASLPDSIAEPPAATRIIYRIAGNEFSRVLSQSSIVLGFLPIGKAIIYTVEQRLRQAQFRNVVAGEIHALTDALELSILLPIDVTLNVVPSWQGLLDPGGYLLLLFRDTSGRVRVAYEPLVQSRNRLSVNVLHEIGRGLTHGLLLRFNLHAKLVRAVRMEQDNQGLETIFWQPKANPVEASRRSRNPRVAPHISVHEFLESSVSRRVRSILDIHGSGEFDGNEIAQLVRRTEERYNKVALAKFDSDVGLVQLAASIEALNQITDQWLMDVLPSARLAARLRTLRDPQAIVKELRRAGALVMRIDTEGITAREAVLDLFERVEDEAVGKAAYEILVKSKLLLDRQDQIRLLNRARIIERNAEVLIEKEANNIIKEALRGIDPRAWSRVPGWTFINKQIALMQALAAAGRAEEMVNLSQLSGNNVDELVHVATAYAEVGLVDEALEVVHSIEDEPWQKAAGLARISAAASGAGRRSEAKNAIDEAIDAMSRVTFQCDRVIGFIAISEAETALENSGSSEDSMEKAVQSAQRCTHPSDKIRLLARISVAHARAGRENESREVLAKAQRAVKVANVVDGLQLLRHRHSGAYINFVILLEIAEAQSAAKLMEEFHGTVATLRETTSIIADPYVKSDALAGIALVLEDAGMSESSRRTVENVCKLDVAHEICHDGVEHCKEATDAFIERAKTYWKAGKINSARTIVEKLVHIAFNNPSGAGENGGPSPFTGSSLCRTASLLAVAGAMGKVTLPEEFRREIAKQSKVQVAQLR